MSMNEYIYPQNLKSQARLWLWNLRDIAVIGVAMIISVLALAQLKLYLPIALTLAFAFLTIRADESSVLDFIIRAVKYFLTVQQYYEWKEESVGTHCMIGSDIK